MPQDEKDIEKDQKKETSKARSKAPANLTLKVPTEYFDEKSLMNVGGTTLAVWLTCAVLNHLTGEMISGTYWRWIAFVLSLVMTFAFAAQKGTNKIRTYIIIILNGLVIYAGASGFNAINKGVDAWDKGKKASLIPFKDAQWWPDVELNYKLERLSDSVIALKRASDRLIEENTQLKKKATATITFSKPATAPGGLWGSKPSYEQLERKLKELKIKEQNTSNALDESIKRQENLPMPNGAPSDRSARSSKISMLVELLQVNINGARSCMSESAFSDSKRLLREIEDLSKSD